jgi:hypothetical protein
MAKIYVQIIPVSVKIDDTALKPKLADRIKKAFETAIEASGTLTKTPPKDAKEKGFALDINFTVKMSGPEVNGELNVAFSYRPKKAIFGHAKQGASGSSMKMLDDVLDAILAKVVPQVIAKLKAQIPKLADV